MTIQGGDKAVQEPWRIAVCYMHEAGLDYSRLFGDVDEYSLEMIEEALKYGLNCNETSSIGRLFDCVAAMLGLCSRITYDAQGAIKLESIADKLVNESYDYSIYSMGDCLQVDYQELLRGVLQDRAQGKSAGEIAGKFHRTISGFTVDAVCTISRHSGIKDAVLSGGCFENSLLLGLTVEGLEKKGFRVYYHKLVPCNDGGIPLGQLAAADSILRG
jgi:hydrogenase maturation protein HypF